MDYHFKTPKGSVEVICGSMFSGKTEELLRRINRCILAQLRVEMFKPLIDTRYKADAIVSHMGRELPCQTVTGSGSIVLLASQADVVAIDEAQFFDDGITDVCEALALKGIRVIVAGLDMDYLGKPFGQMPNLLAKADYITKLHAICVQCGNIANISYRKIAQEGQVLLGEKDVYEPRCRICAQSKD